jgi:transglycosylase-like protein with SLT domain
MSARLIIRTSRGPNSPWRLLSNMALLLAAACLLVLPGGEAAAQQADDEGAVGSVASILPGDDPGPDDPQPLALEPIAAKPLTSADLPPLNPLLGSRLPRSASTAFGRDWRAGRDQYRPMVEREALAQGVPPALVDAVMAVESRYNSAAVGMDGEIGLMQVMPATARMLGFTGTEAELAVPEINIHYGARYLARAWRLAGEDICTATMKYRAGHGETRFSFLSVDYCLRVRDQLTARGVTVSGFVPQPTFGGSSGARVRSRPLAAVGTVNLATLNARLRSLTDKPASQISR